MEEDFIFNEDTIVHLFDTRLPKRVAFLSYVRGKISDKPETIRVGRFSLSMARPRDYPDDVNYFIHFAVSRGVKHLELEFHGTRHVRAHPIDLAQGFPLPNEVYDHHQNLKSLMLTWCNIEPFRFINFKNLEILTLGWINITTSQLRNLLASCPILNTLKLQSCRQLDELHIVLSDDARLDSLVVENCKIGRDLITLDGPKLRRFIYSGKVARFHMGNTSELLEARLDFGEQLEFTTRPFLCELLDQLHNVRFMTVCSAFLQIIPTEDRHYHTEENMNVEHLTLNTHLHINEYIGIKFMLASCPRMSSLTLCLRPGKIFYNYVLPYGIMDISNFWREPLLVEHCVRQNLQVLNVHGFIGIPHQMKFIEYIVRYGRFLTTVNLYVQEEARRVANLEYIRLKARTLNEMASPYSKISLFNAITYDLYHCMNNVWSSAKVILYHCRVLACVCMNNVCNNKVSKL